MRILRGVILLFALISDIAIAAPRINYTDITSGPDTGVGDGVGSGAIVTIWGQNLGSSQGSSNVVFKDNTATDRTCYVYYWKNSDGSIPGGPADTYTSHKMQEVCISIPDSAQGLGSLKLVVGGVSSNTLPFTVRTGTIYHVKTTGNNASAGTFSSPWLDLDILDGSHGVVAGDIVYSHGVGSTSSVYIGDSSAIVGTSSNPVAVIPYPNTSCSISASDRPLFYNYGGGNKFLCFSKWSMNDSYGQSFSLFQGARIVSNYVTGPTITSGVSGFVGGNCTGGDANMCGGQFIAGNEVEQYGNSGNVDTLEHLIYISNRSGTISGSGYEIGWNNFHDNPIYQGIHVYDQADCGGWATPISIHHNFVKNNGGNQININTNCSDDSTEFYIYNNITYIESDYTATGNSIPAAALRIEAETSNKFYVWNNTFYGWTAAAALGTGIIDFRNNALIGNRGVSYSSGTPDAYDNNLCYDLTTALSSPIWAELNINPEINDLFGFGLLNVGDDTVLSVSDVDFYGISYDHGSVSIGAVQNNASPTYDPPTINAGDDQTVYTVPAQIVGTASADSGVTISGVTCSGQTVTPDDGAWDEQEEAWTCNVVGLVLGPNILEFIATQSDNQTGSDSVTVIRTMNNIQLIDTSLNSVILQ